MTDKPPKEIQDEPGADERFERGIANALATPPRMHAVKRGEPKAAAVGPYETGINDAASEVPEPLTQVLRENARALAEITSTACD